MKNFAPKSLSSQKKRPEITLKGACEQTKSGGWCVLMKNGRQGFFTTESVALDWLYDQSREIEE